MTVRRSHLVCLVLFLGIIQSYASAAGFAQARAALEFERKVAIEQVQLIVNQPVTRLARRTDMAVATYQPGWFHPGAVKPDFKNVDVRKTQDTSYGKNQYVTSDINPGFVFPGAEVEFNSMLKYFYTDYSLPKKKLTNAEMEEINRLYRVIGHCEEELSKLP